MRHVSIIALFILAVCSSPSAYAYVSEDQLVTLCSTSDGVRNPTCFGYIAAIVDSLWALTPQIVPICPPKNIGGQQMAQNIFDFVRQRPKDADGSAAVGVLLYLSTNYPCK
jgi:hypothetical protein